MNRRTPFALIALLSLTAPAGAADRPWTADEAIHQAHKRVKIVVQGRIERAINFDYFIFADDSGKLLLNAASVKQRLAAGDKVVIWGRFLGHATKFDQSLSEIEAIEIGANGTPDAAKILSGRLPTSEALPVAATPSPAPAAPGVPPPPPPPPADKSIESRLRDLEDLKTKGLITGDEYSEQRKRILGDL